MKSSTERASPDGHSAQNRARSRAVSASRAAEHRVPHALMFVMADVAPACKEALQAAGFDVMPFRSDAVADAIASVEAPCAVMWSDPTNCLASAIEEGTAIPEAIEGWRARADEILTLLRKNRRNITLVESDLLTASHADPAWEVLRKRLDIPQHVVLSQPGPQSALSRAIARLAVPQIDSLRDLLEELRASGVSPLTEENTSATLAAAAEAFEGPRSSQDEMALLREQVQIQIAEAHRAEETIASLRDQLNRLTEDNLRLTATQTELEAQNAKLMRDVEGLTTMLSMVYASTSWRVTAPLRGVKRLVSK